MFRVLLSLIAALPLLMPPGMCLCQLSACADGDCETLCGHDQPAVESQSTHHSHCPADCHHKPGCPALATPDHAKLTAKISTILAVADSMSSVTRPSIPAAPNCGEASILQADRPLFLSFRALLI
jgi:hypothetical protein